MYKTMSDKSQQGNELLKTKLFRGIIFDQSTSIIRPTPLYQIQKSPTSEADGKLGPEFGQAQK